MPFKKLSFEVENQIREMYKSGTPKQVIKKKFRIGSERLESILSQDKTNEYLKKFGVVKVVEKIEPREEIFSLPIPKNIEVV